MTCMSRNWSGEDGICAVIYDASIWMLSHSDSLVFRLESMDLSAGEIVDDSRQRWP
jgi:hypothetical protein